MLPEPTPNGKCEPFLFIFRTYPADGIPSESVSLSLGKVLENKIFTFRQPIFDNSKTDC